MNVCNPSRPSRAGEWLQPHKGFVCNTSRRSSTTLRRSRFNPTRGSSVTLVDIDILLGRQLIEPLVGVHNVVEVVYIPTVGCSREWMVVSHHRCSLAAGTASPSPDKVWEAPGSPRRTTNHNTISANSSSASYRSFDWIPAIDRSGLAEQYTVADTLLLAYCGGCTLPVHGLPPSRDRR